MLSTLWRIQKDYAICVYTSNACLIIPIYTLEYKFPAFGVTLGLINWVLPSLDGSIVIESCKLGSSAADTNETLFYFLWWNCLVSRFFWFFFSTLIFHTNDLSIVPWYFVLDVALISENSPRGFASKTDKPLLIPGLDLKSSIFCKGFLEK